MSFLLSKLEYGFQSNVASFTISKRQPATRCLNESIVRNHQLAF